MARGNRLVVEDSEDELPELKDLIARSRLDSYDCKDPSQSTGQNDQPRRTTVIEGTIRDTESTQTPRSGTENGDAKNAVFQRRWRRLRLLTPCLANPLLQPATSPQATDRAQTDRRNDTPKQRKAPKNAELQLDVHNVEAGASSDDQLYSDVSAFIVSDNDSVEYDSSSAEDEAPSRSQSKLKDMKRNKESNERYSEKKNTLLAPHPLSDALRGSSSEKGDPAILRFSPPRMKSTAKRRVNAGKLTPPSSPSNPKLSSPSKRDRIPQQPARPSIDAFWSQDVVNDWNDLHSPKKTPRPDLTFRHCASSAEESGVPPSPTKNRYEDSPRKGKVDTYQRKLFNQKKHQIAEEFLSAIDNNISNGELARLAEPTGGIRIVWSKKLATTAGRANWRREALHHKQAAGGPKASPEYRHHASIELAGKVIDDEERLINVIAHEYCHLANFMISGVKNNPHGAEFKKWAAKCTAAFSSRGVEVTTKHSYAISYKYVWACVDSHCGVEYKRHSKSIDPSKHACGKCKAKLVQIQPTPRAAKGQELGKRSEYQQFVKEHFEGVKKDHPCLKFGEVMALVGKRYREMKETSGSSSSHAKADSTDLEYVHRDIVDDTAGNDLTEDLEKLRIG